MHCSRCGAPLQEEEFFCSKCGFLEDIAIIANIQEKQTEAVHVDIPKHKIFAGFWRRFWALGLDIMILTIVEIIIIAAMGFAIFGIAAFGKNVVGKGTVDHQVIQSFVLGFGSILVIGLLWAYFTGFESSKWQATLGKKMLNVYVTDKAGHRISFGQANLRYWTKIISTLILGIGFLMVAFHKKKRALHDILAGTQVMLKKIKVANSEESIEKKAESKAVTEV